MTSLFTDILLCLFDLYVMIPNNMETLRLLSSLVFLIILAGWVYRSWRALSELKQAPRLTCQDQEPRVGKVTVLIPAKNEEKNIGDCVQSLLPQLRDGDEILVINNCSQDKTEDILKSLGAQQIALGDLPTDPNIRLKYLNTPQTPGDWTGKNFALHLGIYYAGGDWLLFTDADTRHQPGSVTAAVAFAGKNGVDLLTLLPRCLADSFWEFLMQPCAMGYTGLWFPVQKINDPKSRVYFGNGQYMLIRKEHYQKMGGHASVKEAFLEDFALMKKTKKMGARGICAFGMDIYGTRMYDSYGSIWRGWRRIFLHGFEQKPLPLLRCALSVFFFSVLPFIAFIYLLAKTTALSVPMVLTLAILGIMFATAWKAYSIVKAKKAYAFFHPFAALILFMILLDAFQMAILKRPTHWR